MYTYAKMVVFACLKEYSLSNWVKIMKGLFKKLTLLSILPVMLLTGCGDQGQKEDPPTPSPYWDEEIDEYLQASVGEYFNQVPIFSEGLLYDVRIDSEEGVDYTTLYFDTELTVSTANLVYKTLALSKDFTVTTVQSGLYQATKSVSLEYVLVVTYGAYQDRTRSGNVFAIETFLYKDKITEWPGEEVFDFFGCDIPEFEAPYYQFQRGQTEDGTEMIAIAAFGAGKDSETEYLGILKNAGYVVRTGTSTCNAIHHEDKVNLEFYYDEDYEALIIYGAKLTADLTWPTAWVRQLLGNDAIPVYSDPAVTYTHGQAILENGSYYNIIECQYAPKSSLMAYTQQLVELGWEVEGDDVSLPDDWPIFIATDGHMERLHKGTHEVELRYYDPEDPLTGYNYELYYPILMIIIYK